MTSSSERSPIRWPAPEPWWSDRAKEFYRAVKKSGQARFYEQSDVVTVRVACDLLTAYMRRPTAATIDSFQRLCAGLLITEGERRRADMDLSESEAAAPVKRERGSDLARAALGLVKTG